MKQQRKVIVVVMEAAEVTLVEKWAKQGHLPVFRELIKKGVWAKITSPGCIASSCTFPTMLAGINPGKHGIVFSHRQLKSGTYRTIKKYADDIDYECLWTMAGRAGKRVAIFDFPFAIPSSAVNGTMIVGWGTEHPNWKASSQPEGLLKKINQEFGKHELNNWYQEKLVTPDDWGRWKKKLMDGLKKRTAITKHLMQQEDWDLLMINYAELHWAGHIAWNIHDPQHPEYNPEVVEKHGNIILQTYQAMDAVIGEIMEEAPNATLLLVSPLGMASHSGIELMAQKVLERLGVAGRNSGKSSLVGKIKSRFFSGESGTTNTVKAIESIIPPQAINYIKKLVPVRLWDDWTRRFLSLGSTSKNSQAFIVPGDNATLIRINLKGREPNGKIEPGPEYDRLCEELTTAFKELRVVDTGEPAVEKVLPLHKTLHGERLHEMPDLVVVWRNGLPIKAVKSERLGKFELKKYHKRPGGHREYGFMLAAGPGIKKGAVLEGSDLLDVAPTVLSLLDLPVPDYFDGRSLVQDILIDKKTYVSPT